MNAFNKDHDNRARYNSSWRVTVTFGAADQSPAGRTKPNYWLHIVSITWYTRVKQLNKYLSLKYWHYAVIIHCNSNYTEKAEDSSELLSWNNDVHSSTTTASTASPSERQTRFTHHLILILRLLLQHMITPIQKLQQTTLVLKSFSSTRIPLFLGLHRKFGKYIGAE